jgi:hypothetical protein
MSITTDRLSLVGFRTGIMADGSLFLRAGFIGATTCVLLTVAGIEITGTMVGFITGIIGGMSMEAIMGMRTTMSITSTMKVIMVTIITDK